MNYKIASVKDYCEADFEYFYKECAFRKSVLDRLPEQKKKQSLLAWHLLLELLKEQGIKNPAFNFNENGKPYTSGIYISLSHSGSYSAAAVADRKIGIDIEEIKPAPIKVAEKYFSDAEKDFIKSDRDFYRIWTAKEAIIKASNKMLRDISKINTVSGGEIMKTINKFRLIQILENNFTLSLVVNDSK